SAGGVVQVPLNGNPSPNALLTLTAGTRDPKDPKIILYPGDINVDNSGAIGVNVKLDATRNITGLVVARQNTEITAAQNFSGTVVASGTATVNAGGTISGTVVGGAGINANAGAGVDANLVSQNVSVGGATVAAPLATAGANTSTKVEAQTEGSTEKTATLVE